jgi:hypothetical protein
VLSRRLCRSQFRLPSLPLSLSTCTRRRETPISCQLRWITSMPASIFLPCPTRPRLTLKANFEVHRGDTLKVTRRGLEFSVQSPAATSAVWRRRPIYHVLAFPNMTSLNLSGKQSMLTDCTRGRHLVASGVPRSQPGCRTARTFCILYSAGEHYSHSLTTCNLEYSYRSWG